MNACSPTSFSRMLESLKNNTRSTVKHAGKMTEKWKSDSRIESPRRFKGGIRSKGPWHVANGCPRCIRLSRIRKHPTYASPQMALPLLSSRERSTPRDNYFISYVYDVRPFHLFTSKLLLYIYILYIFKLILQCETNFQFS